MRRLVIGLLALTLCHCSESGGGANGNSGQGNGSTSPGGPNGTRTNGGGGAGESTGQTPGGPNGGDGPANVPPVISARTTINTTTSAVDGAAGSTSLVLAKPALFAAGQTIIVQQANGENAGDWERATIASIEGTTATLKAPLEHGYKTDPSGLTTPKTNHAQAIVVQDYSSLTIAPGGTLTAPAYDGITGGILAIQVTGTLAIQTPDGIVMDGAGYRGGISSDVQYSNIPVYKAGGYSYSTAIQPRSCAFAPCVPRVAEYLGGGAGGVMHRPGLGVPGTGGGGGGHATAGTGGDRRESDPADIGGGGAAYGSDDLAAIFFGAGGGAGGYAADPAQARGGSGGGIVIVFAGKISLEAAGAIRASGAAGTAQAEHGGGGGGAGGSVLLVTPDGPSAESLASSVVVAGGAGGEGVFSGGAGGNGRVHLKAP